MKLRRQQVTQVLLGIALVCLAAFLAAVIRNALAQRDPQNALPSLTVVYSTAEETPPLPADIIRRDKYEWRFMFWNRAGGGKDLEVWREIETGAWVAPNSTLDLQFSFEPKSVQVYLKATRPVETEFEPYYELVAPGVEGDYILQIDANWGEGRNVTYYAKIRVPAW